MKVDGHFLIGLFAFYCDKMKMKLVVIHIVLAGVRV